jgi:RsiW-degrading membrane proteinase PrsW (M82 family)
MDWSIISIGISFILGIFAIRFLQRFDVYDREPFWSMAVAVLLGGVVSVVLALGIYEFLHLFIPRSFSWTFAGAFLIVGTVEEFAKLIGLLVVFPLLRKQINEINDSIIYMACVALGFSLVENYMYANSAPGQETLLFMRLFISTPMHITFSVFMGYALYRVFYEKKHFKILLVAYLWGVILHGAFDGVLFINLAPLIIFPVGIGIQQVFALANYTNYLSPYKLRFANIAEKYTLDQVVRRECPFCRDKTVNDAIHFKNIRLNYCHRCRHYHGKQENITRLLNYLQPQFTFGNKTRALDPAKYAGRNFYTYMDTIYFPASDMSKAFFKLPDITALTIRLKNETEKKFRRGRFSPAKYFVEN